MSSYLVKISYKVLGVNQTAVIGVDKGMLPESTKIISSFIKYNLGKGKIITNVMATVSTRL